MTKNTSPSANLSVNVTGQKSGRPAISRYPVDGVHESSVQIRGTDRKIEEMLSDIVTRLERIEEKIDENVYPPESAFKPEFISRIKKARADIKKGKGKTYNSIDDFFKEIEA